MKTLSLVNVSYVYGKGTPFEKEALHGVKLSLPQGKIIGVIGHTGSGKSTLLEMLCGLLPPTEGRVLFDGADMYLSPKDAALEDMKKDGYSGSPFILSLFYHKDWKKAYALRLEEKQARRFQIGLVMQYPEYQLFDETVLSDICYGPKNMGLSEEEAQKRAKSAAALVGLRPELLQKSPFDLSGGEKRRVAIAGVLAMEPDVLVLDEPAAGLDPQGRKNIFDAIATYNQTTGATVILVSHSMEDLAKYCHQVVLMHDGTVVKTGSVEEIFSSSLNLQSYGLDKPQITYIAEQLIKAGIPLLGDLFTVEGVEKALLDYIKGGENK